MSSNAAIAAAVVGTVTSEGQPQSGQNDRSSNNFPNFTIPAGTQSLQWTVELLGPGNVNDLRFDVKEDVSRRIDPTFLRSVPPGQITPVGEFVSGGAYYIANPRNVLNGQYFGTSFVVTVYTA